MQLDDVTAIIREHVDPRLKATAVTRGPVGNSQETWFVEARAGDEERALVVRRTATAGVLEWTERGEELAVLRALACSGLPLPEVYGAGTLERPYLVMARLPGAVPGRLSTARAAAVARQLGGLLARLHALDATGLGLELPGSAREATLAEVDAWTRRYHARRAAPIPLLGALLAWTGSNVPDDGAAPVVVWGDAGPHNTLVDGDLISGLVDWELAHLGHPLEDLGAAVWACLGSYDAAEVVAGYEAEAGPVDRCTLDYFVALACVTRTVMIVNGVVAWIEGALAAPSTAGLGLDLVAFSLARGALAAGWGALPPSDGRAPELPLSPSPAESVAGVAGWLGGELIDGLSDRRLRRLAKSAAALLAATVARIPERSGPDLGQIEERAVAAERRGGDPAIRAMLLADLAREWERLEPLTRLHGHPRPWRGEAIA